MKRFSILLSLLIATDIFAETISFIGTPTSVVKSQYSCEHYLSKKDEEVICMNVAFVLNYEVSEWIEDSDPMESVEFIGFYHFSGIPNYTAFPDVLVVLEKHNEYLLLRSIRPILNVDSEVAYVCASELTAKTLECSDIQEVKQYLSLFEI